jgi:Flp pilus assembly protein TadD
VPARFVAGICIIAWIGCSRHAGSDGGAAPSANGPAGDASTDAPLTPPRHGDGKQVEQAARFCARANQLDQGGAAGAALAAVNQALAADPACLAALLLRAKLEMREGELYDPVDALVDARLAALLAPDDPDVVATEGFARHMNGDATRARALLERWLALPPQPGRTKLRASAEEALGFIALRHGDPDGAERHFEAGLKLNPGRATICYGLAMVSDARGDPAGKEHWLDESLQRDPHSLTTRNARLALLVRQQKRVAAEQEKKILALLRQLKDDTSEAFAQDHAGKAALWGELSAALPGDVRSRLFRLRELLLAGDAATAASEGAALIAAGRVDAEAVMETASALAQLGRGDEARRTLAALDQCDPPLPPEARLAANQEIERQIAAVAAKSAAPKSADPKGKQQ